MTTVLEKAPAAIAARTHERRWWILAILGIAQLMIALDATVVNIALPTAQTDLAFSDGLRQWIVTAYALAFGSLLLVAGRISDIVGRKRVFLVGIAGFAIASAVGGASPNVETLIASRAIQGAFAALLAPAILSLLTTTFSEPHERGKAFGVFGAIAGAGASIGLLLGGFLTEYANWRWTLYVNLVFAVVCFAGGWLLLHDTREGRRPTLDLPGTLVVSAGLFAVVYGFSHAESDGWTNWLTLTMLVAGAVLLAVFVALQQRVREPLLPMRILLDRNRAGALVAMFTSAVGMFGVFLFLTYYLQTILRYSAVQSGVAFLPLTGALIVTASLASSVLVTRVSSRILIPAGMLVAAVGMYLFTSLSADTSYASGILPGSLLVGVGLGLVFAPGFSLATLGVRASDSGVASATVNVMQQVGGAIGTALLNTIAASAATAYATSHRTDVAVKVDAAIHSYTVTFWWSAAIFTVGAILAGLLLRNGVPSEDEQPATPVAVH